MTLKQRYLIWSSRFIAVNDLLSHITSNFPNLSLKKKWLNYNNLCYSCLLGHENFKFIFAFSTLRLLEYNETYAWVVFEDSVCLWLELERQCVLVGLGLEL